MASFNDVVLQSLKDLTEGQRDMRAEMNEHFATLNGRLRTAETTLATHESHEPRIAVLETTTAETSKQVVKVKTVIATITATGSAAWAIFANWDKVKALLP